MNFLDKMSPKQQEKCILEILDCQIGYKTNFGYKNHFGYKTNYGIENNNSLSTPERGFKNPCSLQGNFGESEENNPNKKYQFDDTTNLSKKTINSDTTNNQFCKQFSTNEKPFSTNKRYLNNSGAHLKINNEDEKYVKNNFWDSCAPWSPDTAKRIMGEEFIPSPALCCNENCCNENSDSRFENINAKWGFKWGFKNRKNVETGNSDKNYSNESAGFKSDVADNVLKNNGDTNLTVVSQTNLLQGIGDNYSDILFRLLFVFLISFLSGVAIYKYEDFSVMFLTPDFFPYRLKYGIFILRNNAHFITGKGIEWYYEIGLYIAVAWIYLKQIELVKGLFPNKILNMIKNSFAFILGGSLSNFAERKLYGGATDWFYIELNFSKSKTAVIANLADFFIFAGIIIIIITCTKLLLTPPPRIINSKNCPQKQN